MKAYTDVLLSFDNFFFKLEDLNAILSGYARNGSLSLADDLFHVAVEVFFQSVFTITIISMLI